MGQTIQVRRGVEANLPTLNNGELALTTDTKDLYVGTPTGNELIGGSSISSQLAENAYKSYNSSLVKSFISKAFNNRTASNCFNIVGDSWAVGTGATSKDKGYASLIFNTLRAATNSGQGGGYDTITNFAELPSDVSLSGTTSIGTLPPLKRSLVLQTGAVITLTGRICDYIEFFFRRTPTSGSIEVRQDGVLVRTFNCAGTDQLDANSLSSMFKFSNGSTSHTYTLTCINASVELTGLMCLVANTGNNAFYANRITASGYATSDFIDSATLTSLKTIGSFGDNRQSLFIIALGTNDIYSGTKAVTSATYKTNLSTIINSLKSAGHLVLLTVPAKADESKFAPVNEPYQNYVQAVYELAVQYGLPFTDLSKIDLVANNYYATDGVHPNDNGHYAVANFHLDTLKIPQLPSVYNSSNNPIGAPLRPTLLNSWVDFAPGSNVYAEYYKDIYGHVYLRGLIKSGTVTAGTVLFTLPSGYRPPVDRYIPVSSNNAFGCIQIVATTGDVKIQAGSNTWLSLDGVVFKNS